MLGVAGGAVVFFLFLYLFLNLAAGSPPPEAQALAADGAPAAAVRAGQEADTLTLPRARTAPTLDCDVSEWPPEGRISLAGDEPEVLTLRGAGDASDLTARVHLTWTRDTLYVMADVRDDAVRPGTAGGGDWVRVELGATTVWIPAPGGDADRANTGPRTIGDRVPTRICATGYGWLGEVAVPAERLGGDLQLGDLVGLQVLAEDPDGPDEEGHPPYLRWTDVAVLDAAPSGEATADSVLAELREDVTMEELRARPGARDTTVTLPGGDTVPGVDVEVAGVPAVAFADPRSGGEATRVPRSALPTDVFVRTGGGG